MTKSKDTEIAVVEGSKEIAFKDYQSKVPSEVAGMFDVNDNIKGITGRLPSIKIIHQAQMFAFGEDKVKSFKGIILHHGPANAYWEKSFDESGGGSLPDCASLDAIKPDFGMMRQSEHCARCPRNEFGSDGSRGKACKNMWRLHILVEGQSIPKRLTLPPSNLGNVQDFLVYLRDINLPHELTVVDFSLKSEKNKDGIVYSAISFNPISVINDVNYAKNLKKIKEDFSQAFGEIVDLDETK